MNLLEILYRRSKSKFQKFRNRYSSHHVNASSSGRTKYHHWQLHRKARKFGLRSQKLAYQLQIGAAVGIASSVAASQQASAQGLGPFTQVNRLQNPLRAPIQVYSSSAVGHALADVDGDGDIDMYVGIEVSGTESIIFYKNYQVEYGLTKPAFQLAPTPNLDYTSDAFDAFYVSFVDLDGDGIQEMATSTVYNWDVQFASNDNNGTGDFTDIPSPGIDIYDYMYATSLVSVDLDNDSDLDIVVGSEEYGGVMFFQNNGSNVFTNTPLSIETLGINYPTPAFFDIDNDGDQDMFVGDDAGYVHFFLNQESGGVNINPDNFAQNDASPLNFFGTNDFGSYVVPRFIDLDMDGDTDMVLSTREYSYKYSGTNFRVWYNDGANNFTEVRDLENPFGGVDFDDRVSLSFGDLDNDGDQDVIIGSYKYTLSYFKNENGVFERKKGAADNPFFGLGTTYYHHAPYLVDADGDADLDLWLGYGTLDLFHYRNDGSVSVPNIGSSPIANSLSTQIAGMSVFDPLKPTFVDDDGDGDMDAWMMGIYNPSGYIFHFANNGPPLTSLSFAGGTYRTATTSYRHAIDLTDIDHDGDYDILIGETGGALHIAESVTLPDTWNILNSPATNPFDGFTTPGRTAPRAIDWDGDGDLDVFVGDDGGQVSFLQNDNPPANLVPDTGDATFTEDGVPIAASPGISAADDDLTFVQATIAINGYVSGEDQLNFTNQLGITGSWDNVTGVLSLSGNATVSDYVTAMRSITFENNSQDPTTAGRTLEFRVWDADFTDPGTFTRNLVVVPVNDAPSIVVNPGTLNYTENQGVLTLAPGFSASDIDNTSLQSARVSIIGGYEDGKDFLRFTDQNGITGSFAAGVLTLSGAATLAEYITAIQSIGFENTSDDPVSGLRVISFSVNDGVSSSVERPLYVNVQGVNDAPVLTATTGNVSTRSLESPIVIDDQLVVADVDNATLSGATVTVSGNFTPGEDQLAFVNQNGIVGSYSPNLGILALSGAASVADYQTALQSVTYSNAESVPSNAQKTISFVVSDQSLSSGAVTRSIDVASNVVTAADVTADVTTNGSVDIDVISQATIDPSDNVVLNLISVPAKGNAVVNADLTVTYSADADAWGTETIRYELCNQWGSCGLADITFTINNTAPEITQTATVKTAAKSVLSTPFDSFLSVVDLEDNVDPSTIAITQQPISGNRASISGPNLVVDYSNSTFVGVDRLMVSVCDFSGECSEFEVVIVVGELESVNVYNAVSPNGDNIHDFLKIEDIEFFQSNKVFVYDKNGRLVWNVEDYNNVDRIFTSTNNDGEELPNGTYYYAIFLTNLEGNEKKTTGFFVLHR